MQSRTFPPTRFRLRLGLRSQLAGALGIIGALLVAVIVIAFLSMTRIHNLATQTVEVEGRLNRLANNVLIYTQVCLHYEKEVFLTLEEPGVRDYNLSLWDGAFFNLDGSIQAFQEAAVSDDDRQRAETWRTLSTQYREAFSQVREQIQSGAISQPEQANIALRPLRGQIQELANTAQQTAQIKVLGAQRAEQAMLESTNNGVRLMLLIGAIAIGTTLLWSLIFPLRLMRPITILQAAVSRLKGGDLAARTGLTRDDELGALAHGFDTMATTIEQRTQDLEAQHQRATIAQREAEAARAETATQLATIEQQRGMIREISVPILPLSATTLVLPLVGALDTERLQLLQDQALLAIERAAARYLILDITGVPIVDSQVAQGLILVVQAARLLGTTVVLVGVRPEVAQTVVGLGLPLNTITTQSTLQSGIAHVLRAGQRS
jgi:rsbT co-antagonist protein RsbR